MLEDCLGKYYDRLLPREAEWVGTACDFVAEGFVLNEYQTAKLTKIWKNVTHANHAN